MEKKKENKGEPVPPASTYDQNIAFFQKELPQLLNSLQLVPELRGKREPTKNGSLTLSYSVDNTPYYLHSRFNPERESEKLLQSKDLNADHIVVMGLGMGHHLEQIMIKKDPLSRVLIVEPELEILRHSLHSFQWFKWIKRRDFFYVFGADLDVVAETIHDFINIAAFEKFEFIDLPSETRLLGAFFTKARETMEAEIKTNLYDFKTRLAESYMVPRNILKNLPQILKNRPVAHLRNAFQGVPGIIVSAGPSLDKNVLLLNKIKDRAIMVAVDTALKPLLSRSIQPHFTAIGDPSHKNYMHVQGTGQKLEHYIVAEAGISHQVYKDFPRKIFSLSIGKAIVKMLEAHSEPWGEIEAWGSVISVALHFAVYMGLNPIIFVGQDFAFSNTRNHCRGTSWEENIIQYSNSLDVLQRSETQSISGNRKVLEINDIYGHNTYTSERLTLYKNYLARLVAKYPNLQFINATEGGIFSEIPRMNFQEALKRFVFSKKAVNFKELQKLPTLDKKENIDKLVLFLGQKRDYFKEYLERVEEVISMLEKSTALIPDQLLPVIQHAEQLQNLLYSDTENGEIMEMWSAAPMYHFLKSYKRIRGNRLDEVTIRKGLTLFKEYYQGIKPLLKDIVSRCSTAQKELVQSQT
jgi:hypothetical protein